MSATIGLIITTAIAIATFTSAIRQGGYHHRDNCNVTCTKDADLACIGANSETCSSAPVQPICVKVWGRNSTNSTEGLEGLFSFWLELFGGGKVGFRHHFGRHQSPITLDSVCEFCARFPNGTAKIISCCACQERNSTSSDPE